MSKSITIVYQGGLFRPLQPLSLPEHTWLEKASKRSLEMPALIIIPAAVDQGWLVDSPHPYP